MKRGLKIILGSFIVLLLLIAALWVSLAIYIGTHKKQLLTELTSQLNENISGKLTIEEMEPAIIKGFPAITISLKNVMLRDSMWHIHKRDMLYAKYVYMSVSALSMLTNRPHIRDVTITDGSVYLFTDSMGNTNLTLLHKSAGNNSKSSRKSKIDKLLFENMHFVFENKSRLKYFEFDIKKIALSIRHIDVGWVAHTSLDVFVRALAFNTHNGSFLKNKDVKAHLSLVYNKSTAVLTVPARKITIGGDPIKISGQFLLGLSPPEFTLNIQSDKISYTNATSMVSPNISTKLNMVNLDKPVAFSALVSGKIIYRDTPLVNVMLSVKDNVFHVPGVNIQQCGFECLFTNEAVALRGHNDHNSLVTIHHLHGKWSGLPFSVDTIQLINLVRPVLAGKFISHFPLPMLNNIIGKSAFRFNTGTVDVNVVYKGGINEDDTTDAFITGTTKIQNASITHAPHGISFTDCDMTFRFAGNDVYIQNGRVKSAGNVLYMEGSLKNFTNLYYTDPGNIVLNWKIKSPSIALDEFVALLKKRKQEMQVHDTIRYTRLNRIATQLDKMLEIGTVNIGLNVDKLTYRNFMANAISAQITMDENRIELKNVNVKHAGGGLLLNATIDQQNNMNRLKLRMNVNNVNVREFFRSFENFGQKVLTDRNIRGVINANADLSGTVNDSGLIAAESLNGTVSFVVKDATLLNFEPLQKIGKYIFRRRDLSNVQFRELKNTLELKSGKIYIKPMHVESDAITVNITGVYGINKGTDIDIDVPLRNPKKDELIENDSLRAERSMKGIVMHFKAADDEQGNVKLKMVLRKKTPKADVPGKDKPARKNRWWRRKKGDDAQND